MTRLRAAQSGIRQVALLSAMYFATWVAWNVAGGYIYFLCMVRSQVQQHLRAPRHIHFGHTAHDTTHHIRHDQVLLTRMLCLRYVYAASSFTIAVLQALQAYLATLTATMAEREARAQQRAASLTASDESAALVGSTLPSNSLGGGLNITTNASAADAATPTRVRSPTAAPRLAAATDQPPQAAGARDGTTADEHAVVMIRAQPLIAGRAAESAVERQPLLSGGNTSRAANAAEPLVRGNAASVGDVWTTPHSAFATPRRAQSAFGVNIFGGWHYAGFRAQATMQENTEALRHPLLRDGLTNATNEDSGGAVQLLSTVQIAVLKKFRIAVLLYISCAVLVEAWSSLTIISMPWVSFAASQFLTATISAFMLYLFWPRPRVADTPLFDPRGYSGGLPLEVLTGERRPSSATRSRDARGGAAAAVNGCVELYGGAAAACHEQGDDAPQRVVIINPDCEVVKGRIVGSALLGELER